MSGMPTDLNTAYRIAFGIVVAGGLLVGLIVLSQMIAWYRLSRWARQEGVRLVDFRAIPIGQAPRSRQRSRLCQGYRVVVIDSSDQRRSGRVLLSLSWLGLRAQKPEVEWDAPQQG